MLEFENQPCFLRLLKSSFFAAAIISLITIILVVSKLKLKIINALIFDGYFAQLLNVIFSSHFAHSNFRGVDICPA